MSSGGFTTGLTRTSDGVTAEASFLASEQKMHKRAGATYDASVVTADPAGNKIIKAGTLVTPITATGKYGPYDTGASDGRQTLNADISGYCPVSINLRYGDVVEGVIIQGSVLAARVTPALTTAIRTALAGRFIFQ